MPTPLNGVPWRLRVIGLHGFSIFGRGVVSQWGVGTPTNVAADYPYPVLIELAVAIAAITELWLHGVSLPQWENQTLYFPTGELQEWPTPRGRQPAFCSVPEAYPTIMATPISPSKIGGGQQRQGDGFASWRRRALQPSECFAGVRRQRLQANLLWVLANRRPADYESTQEPQTTANTCISSLFSTPKTLTAAIVEQDSEQVAAPRAPSNSTAAVVEQVSPPIRLSNDSSLRGYFCITAQTIQPTQFNSAKPGINGRLQPADAILRESFGDLRITQRQVRKAEAIELVRSKREQRNQTLCFSSRPFVLCGLPVRYSACTSSPACCVIAMISSVGASRRSLPTASAARDLARTSQTVGVRFGLCLLPRARGGVGLGMESRRRRDRNLLVESPGLSSLFLCSFVFFCSSYREPGALAKTSKSSFNRMRRRLMLTKMLTTWRLWIRGWPKVLATRPRHCGTQSSP